MAELADNLTFDFEWESAPGVRPDEFASTWARLSVSVGPRIVTEIEDFRSRGTRSAAYLPLYPLAEWLAFNWWSLRANARTPKVGDWQSGERLPGHGFRHIGDGYSWPNLVLAPHGEQVLARWAADSEPRAHSKIRYLSSGSAVLSREETFLQLSELIDVVIARLQSEGISGTALEDEWDAIQSADDDEAAFSEAAARLGLDPYDVAPDVANAIVAAADQLDAMLLHELLDAISPTAIAPGANWILTSLAEMRERRPAQHLRPLPDLSQVAGRTASPRQVGYKSARIMREGLGLGPTTAAEPLEFVDVSESESTPPPIAGLGTSLSPTARQLTLLKRSNKSERFTAARAIWRMAVGTEGPFLLTSTNHPAQQASRAFAAEFLAPAEGIREFITPSESDAVDGDAIAAASAHFGVHEQVVAHQIENQFGRSLQVW